MGEARTDDADALRYARAGPADNAVLKCQRVAARVLEIQIGSIGPVRRQLRHDAGRYGLVDAKPRHERVFRCRLAHCCRSLHTTALEKGGHRQDRASDRHVAQKFPAFDGHAIPTLKASIY